MKNCPVCKSKMVIILDRPKFPNEKIIVKLHYKCKHCECNVYKTNICDIAEEYLQNKIKGYHESNIES